MGLDMYMKKVRKSTGDVIDNEVAYWRKANQIRNWIVNHTDYPEGGNCIDFLLTKDNLTALVADCKRVLLDHDLAPELLPTKSGFFFGSTDYSGYYFDDIESTVRQVEEILKTTDFETEDIYYCEWW